MDLEQLVSDKDIDYSVTDSAYESGMTYAVDTPPQSPIKPGPQGNIRVLRKPKIVKSKNGQGLKAFPVDGLGTLYVKQSNDNSDIGVWLNSSKLKLDFEFISVKPWCQRTYLSKDGQYRFCIELRDFRIAGHPSRFRPYVHRVWMQQLK